MFSTILTKVNKVNIQFKDRINFKTTQIDADIIKFVKFAHPNQDMTICENQINVHNNINHLIYTNLGTHYQRLNTNTGNKTYFKKS